MVVLVEEIGEIVEQDTEDSVDTPVDARGGLTEVVTMLKEWSGESE